MEIDAQCKALCACSNRHLLTNRIVRLCPIELCIWCYKNLVLLL